MIEHLRWAKDSDQHWGQGMHMMLSLPSGAHGLGTTIILAGLVMPQAKAYGIQLGGGLESWANSDSRETDSQLLFGTRTPHSSHVLDFSFSPSGPSLPPGCHQPISLLNAEEGSATLLSLASAWPKPVWYA